MEKTKHSVVKHLIAVAVALLLFGSSGGVAWGQTPTQMDCKNAFGAGESRSNGYYGTSSLLSDSDPALTNSPYIVLGGVKNVVGQIWDGDGHSYSTQSTCGVVFDAYCCHNYCGTHCGNPKNAPSQYTGCDNTFFGIYNGNLTCGNTAHNYYTGGGGPETIVRVQGGALGEAPTPFSFSTSPSFDVHTIHFKDIPYRWYTYKRKKGNKYTNECSHHSHHDSNCDYYDADYDELPTDGYVDGRVVINAGSHVHVTGNVSADGTGNSKATLDLPTNDQYSLMVDGNIQADKINSQKSGVINGLESLAPYAVLGIQNQFVKGTTNQKIITHGRGGTILIGVATNATSQQAMTITASTDNAGGSFGFSGGNYVYTGTCVPTNGTANLGNYGANDVYVTAVTLPGSLNAGGLQIFNTKQALYMDKAYTISQGGGGHLLMMAHTKLFIRQTQTLSSSTTGNGSNTNLMGGDVEFANAAAEAFIGTGSGEYSVVAFGSTNETPTRTNPSAISAVGLCTLSHPWCKDSELTNLVVALPSTQGIPSTAFRAYSPKVQYGGSCHTSFGGSGDITYSSSGASNVTLSSSHKAQWQAYRNIDVTSASTFTWGNTGSGDMKWVAGTGINLATGSKFPWTAGGSGKAFWQAGNGNITFGTGNEANWTASASGAHMGWQAGGSIISGGGMKANWTSSAAADMWWEAGVDINMPNIEQINWQTTDAGNLLWRAGRDISVSVPSGKSLAWSNGPGSGAILWDAGGSITANNVTTSTFTFTQTGKGNTQWQARADIKANGAKTFTSSPTNGSTMIWRAGGNIETTSHTQGDLVKFSKTTATAGLMAWQAKGDIKTDTKIKFENTNQTNNTNMEWLACGNITTHFMNPNFDNSTPNYDVEFLNDSQGDMIWHANTGNITTNSTTTFKNTNTTGSDMGWYAGHDILTHFGKDNTNQAMGAGLLFKQAGKGKTSWLAGHDIKTYNTVYFDWTATAADDATPITWLAGHDIIIGGDEEVSGDKNGYSVTIPAQAAAKFETVKNNQILLKTDQGMIQTNSRVDFLRNNPGAAVTKLWAGCGTYKPTNNIDIENEFNYVETTQADKAFVHLYAENDILSNQDAASGSCDARPAPILFDLHGAATSKTRTLWEAERNINTRGHVDFNYKGVTEARALVWLARGGYIQTERPVKVVYESNDSVTFRAEDWRHDRTRNNNIGPVGPNRRGNIHFYDSVNIKRYNNGDGVTELKAENHIWTAMMDYWEDNTSPGNKMDIISHKGDIYLGYNDGTPSQPVPHKQYVGYIMNGNILQASPSGTGGSNCQFPKPSDVSYDKNIFTYTIPANNKKGHLWIKAGWEELTDRNAVPDYTGPADADSSRAAGGNIYFTHITVKQDKASNHPTVISIPFSGLWRCDNKDTQDSLLHRRAGGSRQRYENAGIISGVNRCVVPYPKNPGNTTASDIGLIYRGGIGDLTVDAGNRGNIIFNKGAYLNFQDPAATGNATFRTRYGDIDMRDPFNVDSMVGSLAFLAQIDNLSDLSKSDFCGCAEERNNVYLQDFQYKAHGASGSVFVGADNNIKLNYGGLQNIGTRHDPFLSQDYKVCKDGKLEKDGPGYERNGGCGKSLHCDADSNENKARTLLLKFDKDSTGNAITKGGFGAVASDYIDVYKTLAYFGGRGSGMGSVPGTGTLHGENVAGYGLFMKTQANKGNWDTNVFEQTPKCPTPCDGTSCKHDYLHLVSRMTFHNNAYIEAHNQKVMLWSPVIETYGLMTLDTKTNSGNNTEITLKTDSLIFHDDFVKIGNKTKLSTWSGLKNDKPIMKFGHMRMTPPFRELLYDRCDEEKECIPCHYYIRGSKDPVHMLDTITIKFGDDAYLERLNTVVFDHTVLTCLTDSFDHIKGAPVLNAQVRTDTLKIRNQVDLFADKNHERDAHLELISERQMGSKDYAGIYTKHLHMEPVGACGTPYSELWTSDDLALDVITTSIFGGFGFIHSDVHVENGAHLNAGFTSLRLKGQCYEHKCGTQRMKDLRLDVGAQLHFSVGTTKGLNGEYSDAIEVEKLTTYGSVDVNIEVRPCEKMEKRCYPIIYYKSLTPNSLNNLKVKPATVKIDDEEYPLHLNIGTDGIVYVCVGDAQPVDLTRTVTIPSVTGVTTDPVPGIWEVKSRGNFKFKATFSGTKPLAVRTSRMVNGAPEMLTGKKNANGEYEYVIPHVQEDITLTIGPDFVANELLAGTAVWSHGEMIYIRVDRADIASIYSVAGQLVRKIDLPEGDTSIPMSRGAYVITLKDGSVHKVIVK